VLACCTLSGCSWLVSQPFPGATAKTTAPAWLDMAGIPAYSGEMAVEVNGNRPSFAESDRKRGPFEEYSQLDARGRCGEAFALVGKETMPDEPRGDISGVHPSGWQSDTYGWVDQGNLYNRCHLIAWQLAGEDANDRNLITGTRSMNVRGMLPYENEVASYVEGTGNHVLYRVTPVFEGANLVASGVLMEAESVEDGGDGVRFCVWCYNVEPGLSIDYATGRNEPDGTVDSTVDAAAGAAASSAGSAGGDDSLSPAAREAIAEMPGGLIVDEEDATFVLNANSRKFHRPACSSVADMSARNRLFFGGTREQAIELGYDPCGYCRP
jgi:DNA-entry nuclease